MNEVKKSELDTVTIKMRHCANTFRAVIRPGKWKKNHSAFGCVATATAASQAEKRKQEAER